MKKPSFLKDSIATARGYVSPKGELLKAAKLTPLQIAEWNGTEVEETVVVEIQQEETVVTPGQEQEETVVTPGQEQEEPIVEETTQEEENVDFKEVLKDGKLDATERAKLRRRLGVEK